MPLTPGELAERMHRLADDLNHFGDVTVTDKGERTGRRRIEYFLAAPGVPGVHDEVVGRYRETFSRTGHEWLFAKYTYEYLDKIHNRRLAYHLHPLERGGPLVAHAHCGALSLGALDESDDGETHEHLRAVAVSLTEANGEFMACYFARRPPDCAAFRPLQVPRE